MRLGRGGVLESIVSNLGPCCKLGASSFDDGNARFTRELAIEAVRRMSADPWEEIVLVAESLLVSGIRVACEKEEVVGELEEDTLERESKEFLIPRDGGGTSRVDVSSLVNGDSNKRAMI